MATDYASLMAIYPCHQTAQHRGFHGSNSSTHQTDDWPYIPIRLLSMMKTKQIVMTKLAACMTKLATCMLHVPSWHMQHACLLADSITGKALMPDA